jgi:hypothetical protein
MWGPKLCFINNISDVLSYFRDMARPFYCYAMCGRMREDQKCKLLQICPLLKDSMRKSNHSLSFENTTPMKF